MGYVSSELKGIAGKGHTRQDESADNPSSRRRVQMPATPAPSVHDLRAQFETVLASLTGEEAQAMSADTMEHLSLGSARTVPVGLDPHV